ncbi:MAG: oligosaccharide flippase family protein [Caldilineales bacterium]
MSTSSPLNAENTPPIGEAGSARPERRVAINSGLLLVAFSFQAAVSLIMVGIIARYLGQAGLGRYAYVVSFIELFIALVDMGMNRILVREISRDMEQSDRLTSAIWTLRTLLALLVMVIVGVLAAQTGDPELWLAVMVYYVAQVVFLMGDVFGSVFQGYQRMEFQFWGINIAQVLLLALTLLVVWLGWGLVALFAVRLVANGVRLAFLWWTSVQRGYARASFMPETVRGGLIAARAGPGVLLTWRRDGREAARAAVNAAGEKMGAAWQNALLAWHMFVESVPVGISLLLRSYIWRAGIVLTVLWLGQTQGDLVNGVLYGPLRAVQQLRIIPAAFAAAMLPVFSNRVGARQTEFDTAFAKSLKLFLAISLLIGLAFTFLADPLVELLLGESIDLNAAATVLTWLGWVILLYFPNWLYGVTLVALGRQKLETLGLLLGTVAGLAVAYLTIPAYEAMGVVYAIFAAEGVFFLVGTAAMWRHFHWRKLLPSLLRIVLAGALTGVVFLLGNMLYQQLYAAGIVPGGTLGAVLEVIVVGLIGLAGFAGALVLLRTFDEDEKESIAAMLQMRRRKK